MNYLSATVSTQRISIEQWETVTLGFTNEGAHKHHVFFRTLQGQGTCHSRLSFKRRICADG